MDAGKKVIILRIDDGKATQLNEAELKKLLDKLHSDGKVRGNDADLKKLLDSGIRFRIDADKKADEKVRFLGERHIKEKAADKKPAPAPNDLEALSRQLERINLELLDLRKRLEAGKK